MTGKICEMLQNDCLAYCLNKEESRRAYGTALIHPSVELLSLAMSNITYDQQLSNQLVSELITFWQNSKIYQTDQAGWQIKQIRRK